MMPVTAAGLGQTSCLVWCHLILEKKGKILMNKRK
jgi:hypothetical protein